ncbi:MAG: hypothetical protein EKK34_17615 [Mycobacterium sp.]|nr:MAG: hypothetical protein EKK34_17615 [Mycobacterium sp.]
MNDPRRTQQFGPPQPGSGSSWAQHPGNSEPIDYPAYADEMPYASYGGGGSAWSPGGYAPNPTQQLPPQYWQPQGPPKNEEPPEGPPRSPRWLWFVAGAAVLLVIGLVVALVIANGSLKQQTAIEPLPPVPSTTVAPPTTLTTPPTTTRRAPRTTTTAPPGTTTPPGVPNTPGAMQTVVYSVSGEGRAISVMYMDAGDMIQTEFNVALPWTKQVSLSTSAKAPASVTVVNIGHEITCSVTVAGVQVRQRTGQGLTICDAPR